MIKILHTADLHIGNKSYGRFDPSRLVNTRLDDQKRGLDFLVDLAFREQVDAVLLVGDIYDSKAPSPAEEDVFAGFVSAITREGIHILAIAGNHERPTLRGRISPLTHIETLGVENFHLVSEPETRVLDIGKERLAVVCVPWPHQSELFQEGIVEKGRVSPSAWDSLVNRWVERELEKIPEKSIPIIAGHISISGLPQFRGEPICMAQTIARKPFIYSALGHLHKHRIVWHDPPAVYSGGIDRMDFSEMNDPKGAVIVSLKKDSAEWRFIETPARRFIRLEFDLRGMPDPLESAKVKASAFDTGGAIIEIIVLQNADDPPMNVQDLREHLRDTYFLRIARTTESTGTQSKIVVRSHDPLIAFEEYIEETPSLHKDREKLLELARKYIEEARSV